jgi:hypothetical protein
MLQLKSKKKNHNNNKLQPKSVEEAELTKA